MNRYDIYDRFWMLFLKFETYKSDKRKKKCIIIIIIKKKKAIAIEFSHIYWLIELLIY